ncbi:MAG: amino acid adenylation domain-containing protein, partial [Actinomycetota bacterium]|nr:amino acid adenylation domain-containing protein [Actinomycetota bacterium]
GMTATVLPLRVHIDPTGAVGELAALVADTVRAARRHQRFDPAEMVRDLGWPSDGTQGFGPVVNLMAADGPLAFGAAVAVGDQLHTTGATEDVALTMTRFATGTGLRVDFSVDESRCARPGRDGVDLDGELAAFVRMLTAVAADPAVAIDSLAAAGLDVVTAANDTEVDVADLSLAELFAAAVAGGPDVIAVVSGAARLTYGELDVRSTQLARHLVAHSVEPGMLVGVLLARGVDFAVAVLAAVKAGAGYTLLDPEFPAERLAAVLADGGVRLVVTDSAHAGRVSCAHVVDVGAEEIAERSAEPLDLRVSPAEVACVMFTSGSTGRPKGVMSSHRALVGTLLGQSYADFGRGEVFLQCSPVSWDAFSLEFWGALGFGGTVVLQAGQRPEPALIAKLVAEHGITMLQLSSSLFNFLVDEHPDAFTGVRLAFTGGEAASAAHVARVLTANPGLRVVNGYGPAESMGFTTTHPVSSDVDGSVPVGRPVANKRAYVLDSRLRPAPIGVVGEVYLAGIGLAQGYMSRPDLTVARFVADPFGAPGERMYRTGDLARWTAQGVLEFAGRVDDQVKIRGFRVEPDEVAAVLGRHETVGQAAVVATARDGAPARLVGYLVPRAGHTIDASALRTWLRTQVPDHLVPAALVALDRLPVTANGKLDRVALSEPTPPETTGRGPRDVREQILCGLFADVLGIPSVGVDDRFFDLGGHSLLAARLVNRIGATFGVEVGLRDVFTAPTVAELAAVLAVAETVALPGPARPTLTSGPLPDRLPLAPAQRGLWLLDRVSGTGTAYNVPLAARLDGPLDAAALTAAVHDVVGRHEILRTVFPVVDDEPCQRVLSLDALPPLVHRVTGDPDEIQRTAARHRFDLAAEPPLRVTLADLGHGSHLLVLVLHHIATDGMSLCPLYTDLATAYAARCAGAAPDWAPLPVRYADYAVWQHALGDTHDHALDYWRQTLADLPEELALPRDRPRPAVGGHRGGRVPVVFGADRHQRVVALARAAGCTPFMVV